MTCQKQAETWNSADNGSTFEIDGSGEREPVCRPFSSVSQEVVSLRRTGGGIWVCKVICAAYDLVVRRAFVVMVEVGVDERWWRASVNVNAGVWNLLVPSVALI